LEPYIATKLTIIPTIFAFIPTFLSIIPTISQIRHNPSNIPKQMKAKKRRQAQAILTTAQLDTNPKI
jgi:hypothetical protein